MNGSGLDCRIICDATPKPVRQAEGAYLLLFALTLVCQRKYNLNAPITYLFLRCCVTVVFLAIGCRKLEENCACILARTLPKTVVVEAEIIVSNLLCLSQGAFFDDYCITSQDRRNGRPMRRGSFA